MLNGNTGYANSADRSTRDVIQGAAPVAKRATEADRLVDRMNTTMIGLNGLVGRLSRAVDRIVGSPPPTGEGKSDAPTPAGHVYIMDAGFNDVEAALNRFRNELERLESFA